jgi:tRNA-Thr(GGU) m(6)t(6)A37 methyltransferase TsaA
LIAFLFAMIYNYNMNKISIEPVAYIKTDFPEKFGVPRQSGRVHSLTAKIVFVDKYNTPDAIRGIEGFSHLWLIFGFSLCDNTTFSPTVRPPRLGGNTKIGVFASRAPFRPNGLGLSSVKLVSVNNDNSLTVSGADLVDGTPIYDIKPYLPFTDSHVDAVGGYADEHKDYHLQVNFPSELLSLIPKDKQTALIDCLKEDPRPSYQNDDREYGMKFSEFNVKFIVSKGILTVTAVEFL